MRLLILCFAVCLSACSIDNLANKILPDEVKSHSQAAVDAVANKDSAFFAPLKTENFTDEEFEIQLGKMFAYMPGGTEQSRHIVGANSKFGTNSKTGNYKQYDVTYEVKTAEGYGTVALIYVPNPETQACCKLQSIYVNQFETSPFHEASVKAAHYARIGGVIFVLIGIGAVFIFIRRRRKKKQQATNSA